MKNAKQRWLFGTFAAGLIAATANVSQAQIEVLSPAQIAGYQTQLPTAVKEVHSTALQAHLQRLSNAQNAPIEVANAVRVADDMRESTFDSDAFFGYYTVPAMSAKMRLPDAYPTDGEFAGTVRVPLAQDQYQDASFQVYPFKNIDNVHLKLSKFKSDDGSTFASENLDLRVVKVWYQNGNAWLSYFADPGLKLVPELLLHDENLIRVDTEKQANYARIKTDKSEKEIWISAPQKLDTGFDPYQEGFVDAKTLQPVAFNAGQFKQFVLTAHATKETRPGLYRGTITVSVEGEKSVQIPVEIKVLSWQLPLPKTNYDLDKDFLVSLYSAWPTVNPENKAYLSILKNMRAHNILHLGPDVTFSKEKAQSSPALIQKEVNAMKEAGFLTDHIFGGGLPWMGRDFDSLMQAKHISQRYVDLYDKNFGNHNASIRQGDERGAQFMIDQRPITRVLHQHGLKYFIAGSQDNYFYSSGYNLDRRPIAGSAGEAEKANQWKEIGSGYTAFYANQHTGSENPAYVRRQHGLLGYLSNFDMVDNYQFAYGPWNDRAWDLYKPMVLAYPISDGLVDTLQWNGFRAGIDDIRYATKLRQLANEAVASGDLDRVDAGKKVRQWFAMMDGNTVDLNTVRLEMIEKIESLMRMSKSGK